MNEEYIMVEVNKLREWYKKRYGVPMPAKLLVHEFVRVMLLMQHEEKYGIK